jgi:hypothetical protein
MLDEVLIVVMVEVEVADLKALATNVEGMTQYQNVQSTVLEERMVLGKMCHK